MDAVTEKVAVVLPVLEGKVGGYGSHPDSMQLCGVGTVE